MKKHCNTCAYAYKALEPTPSGPVARQKCASPDYNSPAYTHEMFMEGRGQNYCRFWSPKEIANFFMFLPPAGAET